MLGRGRWSGGARATQGTRGTERGCYAGMFCSNSNFLSEKP